MSTVYMTSTSPEGFEEQTPIPFADARGGYYRDHFGIWSCRFSADGNEVIAGGDGHIFGAPNPIEGYSLLMTLEQYTIFWQTAER